MLARIFVRQKQLGSRSHHSSRFKLIITRAFLECVNSTGLTKHDRSTPEMVQRFFVKRFRDPHQDKLPFAGIKA